MMPASYANADAQRFLVASQWKQEIRDFCQRIQADIRQVLSTTDRQVLPPKEHDISNPPKIMQTEPTNIEPSSIEAIKSEPTKNQPIDSETCDAFDDPMGSTEDRLRKLREQLNNLIDEEDV